jgi:branched-chain amino acid transport system permease protein
VNELTLIVVRGLGNGACLALIAMSFNIVRSSSGVLNFAQGHLFVLGGLIAVLLVGPHSSIAAWLAALGVAGAAIGVLTAVQGAITLLPLRSGFRDTWIITTMAVSVIISALLLLVQGPFTRPAPAVFPAVTLSGMRTPSAYLLTIGLAVIWFVALRLFGTRTRSGVAISALSQDLDAARAAGLNVGRLQVLAFGISGAIVGSAGFVAAPVIAIAPDSGITYVLNGFSAAVIGGIGSDRGALLGGAVVGIITMAVTYKIGGQFQPLASLLVLGGVLMVRPQGVFGRTMARAV